MTSMCAYFSTKPTNNMASVLKCIVRTLYANVRANGSCYTVLLEQARATNYLQADVDTTATLRRYIRIFIYNRINYEDFTKLSYRFSFKSEVAVCCGDDNKITNCWNVMSCSLIDVCRL